MDKLLPSTTDHETYTVYFSDDGTESTSIYSTTFESTYMYNSDIEISTIPQTFPAEEKATIGAHWNYAQGIPFIPIGLSLLLITFFGLIGNILGAMVLSRFKIQSTYSIFNFWLALMDSGFLIIGFLRYGLGSLLNYFQIFLAYNQYYLMFMGPYLRPITFITRTGSIFFTMALAFDRWFVICYPLKAKVYWTRKVAIRVSAVVLCVTLVYNTSRWMEMVTDIEYDPITNASKYVMIATPLRNSKKYREYFIFWAYVIFLDFIPFFWVGYCNYAIWRKIKAARIERKILTSTEKWENSLGLMLIFVAVIFILCSLDYLILDILDYMRISYSRVWSQLGNVCHSINSFINFPLYCVLGRKFRLEFIRMFSEIVGYTPRHLIVYKNRHKSDNGIEDSSHDRQTNSGTRRAQKVVWRPGMVVRVISSVKFKEKQNKLDNKLSVSSI